MAGLCLTELSRKQEAVKLDSITLNVSAGDVTGTGDSIDNRRAKVAFLAELSHKQDVVKLDSITLLDRFSESIACPGCRYFTAAETASAKSIMDPGRHLCQVRSLSLSLSLNPHQKQQQS